MHNGIDAPDVDTRRVLHSVVRGMHTPYDTALVWMSLLAILYHPGLTCSLRTRASVATLLLLLILASEDTMVDANGSGKARGVATLALIACLGVGSALRTSRHPGRAWIGSAVVIGWVTSMLLLSQRRTCDAAAVYLCVAVTCVLVDVAHRTKRRAPRTACTPRVTPPTPQTRPPPEPIHIRVVAARYDDSDDGGYDDEVASLTSSPMTTRTFSWDMTQSLDDADDGTTAAPWSLRDHAPPKQVVPESPSEASPVTVISETRPVVAAVEDPFVPPAEPVPPSAYAPVVDAIAPRADVPRSESPVFPFDERSQSPVSP